MAREYWICHHGGWYDIYEVAMEEHSQSELVHVIEASYAKELEAEVERLNREFKIQDIISQGLAKGRIKDFMELDRMEKEYEAKLAVAIKALEFLADKEERNTYMENVRFARQTLEQLKKAGL